MKNLLIISLVLLSSSLFAQYGQPQITYDPTQASNMGSQITTSMKQLTEMQKTVDYMRKTQETLSKVNNYVQTINEAEQVANNYKQALDYASQVPKSLAKYENKESRDRVNKSVIASISSINASLQFMQRLLTNDGFNMNDYERIKLIQEENTKAKLMKNKMKNLAR